MEVEEAAAEGAEREDHPPGVRHEFP